MKPKMKYDRSAKCWLCGGLFVSPWYIDWYSGDTPQDAYDNWKKSLP